MSSLNRAIQSHLREFEDNLYTTTPAIVLAYDPLECTVDVQPAILKATKEGALVQEARIERVPLEFSSVTGSAITFPVKVGDYVALHFLQSNADNFFEKVTQEGGEEGAAEKPVVPRVFTRHNNNDVYATVGLRSYNNTPVKRDSTFDLYFKDSRLTFSEDGKIELELLKTDEDPDNPQETQKQIIEVAPSGDLNIQYTKVDGSLDSQIQLLADGSIKLSNNKESSNLELKANGDISSVTKSKFSMDNGTVELVGLLSDALQEMSNITTNTIYAPTTPVNNKAAILALKSKLDTLKV